MQKSYALSFVKRIPVFIGIIALAQVFCNDARGQQFTAGRLVVERVGTGSAQTADGTPIFLDEYTTTGVPGISVAMPTVTAGTVNRTVESGVTTSGGMIKRSLDGKMVVVPGYDAAPGAPAVASSPLNKVITLVNGSALLQSTVVTNASAFPGNAFRGVATSDGSQYWLSGAGTGPVYVGHQGNTTPVAGTELSTASTDNRSTVVFNNRLYQSTTTGMPGVYVVGTGLPTTGGQTMTIAGNATVAGDPNDFVIIDNGLPVMYVADFANKLVRKYFLSSGTWFSAGAVTVTVSGVATGFYGITGHVTGGGVIRLFATTTNGVGSNSRIVTFTDGATASTTITGTAIATTLVGPTVNTAFHGISFVPFSVTAIASAAPAVCTGTGTTITISGNPNSLVTYQRAGIAQPAVTIGSAGTYSFNTGPLTANTTYTVISATDGNVTQTYSNTITVSVNALPPVTVSAGGAVCPGTTLGLVSGGATTYSWAPASGLSATTGNSISATPVSTTSYTVTGTDLNGCMNTARVTVTVNSLPSIGTGTPVAICIGASANLVASGGVSYTWAPSTGLSSTVGSPVTASPTTTTTYTITGTGVNGCVNTVTNTVTVNNLPIVTLSPDVAICRGSSTGLTASGAAVYTWGPSAGLYPLIGSSVTANPTTTTSYTVTGTDGNGCRNTATVNVFVNSLPVVAAGGPVDMCEGTSTVLNATGALSYSWAPGTGLSPTTGSSVTASPIATTNYTVTGTDGNGCVNTARVTVNVRPLPHVSGSAVSAICAGASTGLSAVGAISYIWSPAMGLSATTGNSIVANPPSTTTYMVTGASSYGCVNSAPVTVTVYPIPTVSAGPDVAICNGSSTVLTATGATTYSWAPGYGLSVTTGGTVTANPTTTTTYTVTGINACVNRATVTVSVNPLPAVIAPGATICMGSPVALTASGAATYTWVPATGLSATTGGTVTANPTANTIYTVTGTDANGCVRVITSTVNVNLLPTISAGAGVDICNGSSTTLRATGGVTYTWAPGTGLSATTGGSVVANPSATTTYTVAGTSAYGCVNRATVRVGVNAMPAIFSVTGGGNFCAGTAGVPVGLSGSQGGINYEMFVGSIYSGISRTGTGGALDFGHPPAAGFYTIVATDPATACTDTMSGGAGIVIVPLPIAVTVTGGGAFCTGGAGVHVGLSGSVSTVDYQLYRDGIAVGSPLPGVGYALDFGLQAATGTYTVIASVTTSSITCTNTMLGSAAISTLPLPARFAVSGGGVYCEGGTGVHIGLTGSQIGVRYGVYLGGAPVSSTLIGMATPLDFGLFTAPGTYYITGTYSTVTACTDSMSGSATITINPLPTITGQSVVSPSDTATLTGLPAGGTWSSRAPAIASISAAGLVRGVTLGSTEVTYTLPNGCYKIFPVTIAYGVGVAGVNNTASFISIAPNPNNGVFMLNGVFADKSAQEATIEITDVPGRVIYTNKVTVRNGEMNEQIAIKDIAPGFYILSLKTATENKVLRFVKEQ